MNWYFLIERHLQLEIYFSLSEQHHQHCATILNHILESICLTEEKHINQEGEGAITKVDSFLCSCGKGSAPPHLYLQPSLRDSGMHGVRGDSAVNWIPNIRALGVCTLHSLHCLLVIVTFVLYLHCLCFFRRRDFILKISYMNR